MANPIHSVTITGRATFDTTQAQQGLADLKSQAGGVKSAVEDVSGQLSAAHQAGQAINQEADAAVTAAREGWDKLSDSFKDLPRELQSSLTQVKQAIGALDLGRLIDLESQLKLPPHLTADLEKLVALGREADKAGGRSAYQSIFAEALPEKRRSENYAGLVKSADTQMDTLEKSLARLQAGNINDSTLNTFRGGLASVGRGIELARERADAPRRERRVDELASRLDDISGRFNDTLSGRPDILGEGERPSQRSAYRRLARGVEEEDARLERLDPVTASRSTLLSMRERAERLGRDVTRAREDGLSPDRVDTLNDNLAKLSDKLEGNIRAYNDSHGAEQRITLPGEQPPGQNPVMRTLQDELRRMSGMGMGQMGMLGRLAGRLGLAGLAVGAVTGAATLADRFIVNGSRKAEDETLALGDLARQYGSDRDPWGYFRDGVGGSDPRLYRMGYTGTDAARVAATFDRPGAGKNRRGFIDDAVDILTLSRSTGLDEGTVARSARSLSVAGAFGAGDADRGTEILKAAIAQGLKEGISGSDTLRNLTGFVEASYREGRSSTRESLAFQMSLQQALAATGSPVMQGDAGAQAQRGLMGALTGGSDPSVRYAMHGVVEDLSAEDLGLVYQQGDRKGQLTPEGVGYDRLRAQPGASYKAAELALNMVADGRAPQVVPKLWNTLERLTGGREDLMLEMLTNNGVSEQQALVMLAEGGGITTDAANLRDTTMNPASDAQGGNRMLADAAARTAIGDDASVIRSIGVLGAGGDWLNQRQLFGNKGARLLSGALPKLYQNPDGSMSGVVGAGLSFDTDLQQGLVVTTDRDRAKATSRAKLLEAEGAGMGASMDGVTWTRATRGMLGRFEDEPEPAPAPGGGGGGGGSGGGRPGSISDADNAAALGPAATARHLAALRERARLKGLSTLAFGGRGGSARLTTQVGDVYGDDVDPALQGHQHQGFDLVIGEKGKPDPIYNPFERARLVQKGGSEKDLGGYYGVFETQNGDRYKMAHLNEPLSDGLGTYYKRGEQLATEGMSGAATGFHLHMERFDEGDTKAREENMDPLRFWKRFEDNLGAPQLPDQTASAREVKVTVVGLDNVRVEGVPGEQAVKAGALLQGFLREIVTPDSYGGIG